MTPEVRQLLIAAVCWVKRANRTEHPDGTFDKAKRWYPSDHEWQWCCKSVRGPSRNFPYAYLTHCRSSVHIATMLKVDPVALRRAVNILRKYDDTFGRELLAQIFIIEKSTGKIMTAAKIKAFAAKLREELDHESRSNDISHVGVTVDLSVDSTPLRQESNHGTA